MTFVSSTISAVGHALPATRSGRLLILIYHRVHAQPDPMFPLDTTGDTFDWHMASIRRYCNPVSLADGVRMLGDRSLPSRAVAVTFDDGYADNATVALPILQRHGIPATFFVASGFLDGGRMWNDTIIECVRRAPGAHLDLTPLGLAAETLGPEAGRWPLAERIIRAVKHLHPSDRSAKVRALQESLCVPLPDDLMMASSQVCALADAGMEVGAHTVSHPILRTLPETDARDEIERNRRALERILERPVRAFAYPNGRPGSDYTERDVGIVRSLGFGYAVSTRRGAASPGSDTLQLPRFTPWDRSPERWLARLLLEFGRPA